MREAVIVSVARTPIGRAKKGSLKDTRPEYFASEMINGLIDRTPGLEKAMVNDIILGCAMPEGEQGMNVARLITLAAGFPTEVPAITIHRPRRWRCLRRRRRYGGRQDRYQEARSLSPRLAGVRIGGHSVGRLTPSRTLRGRPA